MEAVSKDKERVAKAPPTGFSGNLAIVPIMDVLEKVRNQAETGVLSIWTPMVKGTVWVRRGEAVDAEVGVRRGIAALDLFALLGEGSFSFEVRDVDGWKPTVEMSSSEVLRRWRAMETQCSQQLNKLPPLSDQIFWNSSADPKSKGADDAAREILGQLRQGGTLLEVMVEVRHDMTLVLDTLVAASELFREKSDKAAGDAAKLPSDRESPKPIWTAPPPPLGGKTRLGVPVQKSEAKVEGLGGHLTSANPRRRFLVPPSANPPSGVEEPQPAVEAKQAAEKGGARAPNTALAAPVPERAAPTNAQKLGARTLVGVPMEQVLATQARASAPAAANQDPLDGIAGDLTDNGPTTIRNSGPPRVEPFDMALLAIPPNPVPNIEHRVIPREQWDGRRSVSGVLELSGRVFDKVQTLASGSRFVCELVEETEGLEPVRWVLKMPARPGRDKFDALENEARLLSQMKHHAIVEFGSAGRDVETPFLLTRHHPGATLLELHERLGKLPFPVIAAITKQVLQALVYMHDSARPQGAIIHGNVCPDNVLVGWDGVVKLTGLSSARRMLDGRIVGDVRVQARYASPELLRGEEFDGRADVFSVGALLRFDGDSSTARDRGAADEITRRATAPDAQSRYPHAAQMLLELSEVQGVYSVGELADWLAQAGVKEGGASLQSGGHLKERKRESVVRKRSNLLRQPVMTIGVVVLVGVLALLVFWLKG